MIQERRIVRKDENLGVTPSIILCNPKDMHNIGGVLRAANCFGFKQVWYTGDRIEIDSTPRIPRELRMKKYDQVDFFQCDYPFDCFSHGTVPVAVEIVENSENLIHFEHPENAVYVFGPEDGSIPQVMKQHCHRFVTIPTRHCLNLAASVNIIMYDRMLKLNQPLEIAQGEGWRIK